MKKLSDEELKSEYVCWLVDRTEEKRWSLSRQFKIHDILRDRSGLNAKAHGMSRTLVDDQFEEFRNLDEKSYEAECIASDIQEWNFRQIFRLGDKIKEVDIDEISDLLEEAGIIQANKSTKVKKSKELGNN